MPDRKTPFILLCRQALAAGTVLAVAAPAASVVTLDLAGPTHGGQAALVASGPVRSEVTEVPVEGVVPAGLDAVSGAAARRMVADDGLAALSAPEPVAGFATVGVTWKRGEVVDEESITISVRTLQDDSWSGWERLQYHDDHGPDPGSAEARKARPGTDPTLVGDVDEVQVKAVTASGDGPDDMALAIVDPGADAAPEVQRPAIETARTAATRAARPKIFSRAQWGANERMRDKGSLRYGKISAGFVHHTVNANSYTQAQVPSLIRGIYAYHTQSLGWSDVGYNFLVDRFGRIWEGRYGGVSRPVVGAHTLGYNDYAFAMSAIGNFETTRPRAAMLDAYGRLFAWKLSLHGVDARSARQRVGSRNFHAINGHRDAGSTACPGRYLYAKLATIRQLAAKHQKATKPPRPPPADPRRSADISGSSWPDVVVRGRASKRAFVVQTGGQLAFNPAKRAGQRWDEMDLVAGSRDLTGDGIADMVARNGSTRSTGVHPGDGRGGFGSAVATTTRFSGADQVTGVRDLDGDGKNDLVARDASTKALYLHPGNGNGGFSARRLLASAWRYNMTVGVGDLDEDGTFEIAARRPSGSLQLFSGTNGALGSPTTVPNDWDVFDLVTGLGDLTNDGHADIVARNADSKLTYIYPGDGQGGLRSRLGPFAEFKNLDFLTSPGQVAGSNRSDLVGRDSTGWLVSHTNTGRKNITGIADTGTVLAATNLIVNVGDWDDDGHGDMMTRSTDSGRMHLRRGDGQGHFAGPVLAAEGWGAVGSISAAGDVTGDGRPDLVGRPRGGSMRTYPGNGDSGFLRSRPASSAVTSQLSAGSRDKYDWMLNVGDANGDREPDLIAREKTTGRLWLMPGAGEGFGKRRLIGEGFSSYDLGG